MYVSKMMCGGISAAISLSLISVAKKQIHEEDPSRRRGIQCPGG